MASENDDLLPLFGYVVAAVRESGLPTEYALIPFVESGYRPGARSPGGTAGLWQLIAITARNHNVPIRAGYDGRLSPIDSTRAAVRYLKTLHSMFAGDWRLAVMAYNAGEYRVLGALQAQRPERPQRQAGNPARLVRHHPGLCAQAAALSCLLEQADDREEWLQPLDRPVPRTQLADVARAMSRNLAHGPSGKGHDRGQLRRLNPAFAAGRLVRQSERLRVLAPSAAANGAADTAGDVGSTVAIRAGCGADRRRDRPAATRRRWPPRIRRARIPSAAANRLDIARRYGISATATARAQRARPRAAGCGRAWS